MEAIKLYDVLGDLAGNLTILSGCVVTGSSISSGVVAINGECYYFEGGLVTSTVYINTQQIYKTFQDQTDKILIEKKSVKFGTSTPQNTFNWSDFFRLDTIKAMQEKISKAALQTDFVALEKRVAIVELKTAPIINGGVVLPWFKPLADIPFGWKECTDLRGKTIVGVDPNDVDLSVLKNTLGAKKHTLTIDEMPEHSHKVLEYSGIIGLGAGNRINSPIIPGQGSNQTSYTGKGEAHNNMQPSILAYYIEPDFQ